MNINSPELHRAFLLYQNRRFAEAEQLIRQYMATDANNEDAILLLSDCLLRLDRAEEAAELVTNALKQGALSHELYAQAARILDELKQPKEAMDFVNQAIMIAPWNADHKAYKALLFLRQKEYKDAIEEAEKALAAEPDHDLALNVRAGAQMNLRQRAGAYETLETALQKDPENSYTHANMGWAKLQGNDVQTAQEHFREALRLDPVNKHARTGMATAMKAKNIVYRVMLNFFFWMGSLKGKTQWYVIIGAYVIYRIFLWASANYPALSPFISPILFLYIGFVLLSWAVEPLADGILLFDKYGKHALTPRKRKGALLVWPAFLLSIVSTVAYLVTKNDALFALIFFGLSMLIPLSTVMVWEQESKRKRFGYIAGALGLVGVFALIPVLLSGELVMNIFGLAFVGGIFIFQFYANFQRT